MENSKLLNKIHNLNLIAEEIRSGNLSVFAGAGLSSGSGYVDWKKLMTKVCEQLNLSPDNDLTAIAQYYENRYGRQYLNMLIIDEFNKIAQKNYNLDLLTSLPIDTYWTTNYDSLIEDALESKNKIVDKKTDQVQFKYHKPNRDAVVYKMHGDKECPDDVVITKLDYETYDKKRWFFTQALVYELITKTFLFIGFSFADPNLDRILSIVRNNLNGKSPQNHYCFMRGVQISDYSGSYDKYAMDKNLQELKIEDMRRYGIQTILVDEFSQITDMLVYIKSKLEMGSVFISGSVDEMKEETKQNGNDIFLRDADKFMLYLSKALIKQNYRIISGFGKGVGNYIVSGALNEIYDQNIKVINKKLNIHPMITMNDVVNSEVHKAKLREKLIDDCGYVICLFGRMKNFPCDEDQKDGVYREYEIAKKLGKNIIPVGITGFTSKYIFDLEIENIKDDETKKLWIDLNNKENDYLKLIDIILKIMNKKREENEIRLINTLRRKLNIFISFQYNKDIDYAKKIEYILNRKTEYSVINIESSKLDNEVDIYKWINNKLLKTDSTILLIGDQTYQSDYVRHEIIQSAKLKKGIVPIFINDNSKNPLDYIYLKDKITLSEFLPSHKFSEDNLEQSLSDWIDESISLCKSIKAEDITCSPVNLRNESTE